MKLKLGLPCCSLVPRLKFKFWLHQHETEEPQVLSSAEDVMKPSQQEYVVVVYKVLGYGAFVLEGSWVGRTGSWVGELKV